MLFTSCLRSLFLCWGDKIVTHLYYLLSSFVLLWLVFTFHTQKWFLYVSGRWAEFHFSHVTIQLFQHHCWKALPFTPILRCQLCPQMCGSLSRLYSILCLSCDNTTLSSLPQYYKNTWYLSEKGLPLCSSTVAWLCLALCFPMNTLKSACQFHQPASSAGILAKMSLNPQTTLREQIPL